MTGKDLAAHVSTAEPMQPEVHASTTPAQPPAHAPDAQGPKPHAPPLSTESKASTEPRGTSHPRSRRTSTLEPARSRMPKSDDVKKLDQEWTKGGKEVIRRHQAVEILMHTSGDSLADEDIVPRDDIERHNIESYVTDAGYDLAGMSIAESDIGSFALSELDDGPDRDAHNYVIRVDGKEVSMKDPSDGSKKGMAEAAAEAEAVAATAAKSAARLAAPGVQESAEIVSFSDLLSNDVFGSWTSSGMPTQANTAVQSTVHSNRHLIMVPVEKEESGFLLEPLQEQQESAASIRASNAAVQQTPHVSLLETPKQPSEPTAAATQASNEADFRMSLLRRRSNGLDVSASKAGTMPQYQFPTQPDSAGNRRAA
ncbi:hypothetical protein DL89DRAFT_63332 [Linderina pennispora]|uniref:Uncharacterized protein n=1 Tax=Linderina pennispora TaxID=61395 RepID=A0A1Y1VRG8_9FUNG|nr:uncharacterized protein DL89DRAFT_63332 [Linderina pennispora]ORX63857.1 hypothetical protein DL89DRAFT_63332 [Linderina pennispora]